MPDFGLVGGGIPLPDPPILAGMVEGFDLGLQAVASVAGLDAAIPHCTFQLAFSDGSAEEVQLVQRGRKPVLVPEIIQQVRRLREGGKTVPEIMRMTDLSKASIYRALAAP